MNLISGFARKVAALGTVALACSFTPAFAWSGGLGAAYGPPGTYRGGLCDTYSLCYGITGIGYGGMGYGGVGRVGPGDCGVGYAVPSYGGYGYGASYGHGIGNGYGYGTYPDTSYSRGYSAASMTTQAQTSQPPSLPYRTTQTYEPGDGHRYPLYYNPSTRSYIYHPVAR